MENLNNINQIIEHSLKEQINCITLATQNAMKYSINNYYKPTINFSNIINSINSSSKISNHIKINEIFETNTIIDISKQLNYNTQHLLKITEQFQKNISNIVKPNFTPIYETIRKIDTWSEIVNENGIVKMFPNGISIENYTEIFTSGETLDSQQNNEKDPTIVSDEYQQDIYKKIINTISISSLEHSSNKFFNDWYCHDSFSGFFVSFIILQILVIYFTNKNFTEKLDDE